MGYTHYWDYHPEQIQDETELKRKFSNAVKQIKKCHAFLKKNPYAHEGVAGGYYDESHCKIRGGLGEGLPVFKEDEILFNGDAKQYLDHESFHIKWDNKGDDGGDLWGFCKTARKPYDVLVCMSLIALEESFNDSKVFSYSSDGDESEWQGARDLYREIFSDKALSKKVKNNRKKVLLKESI
jgi:hypothetical protein